MPRTSTIERHPSREKIDKAIIDGVPERQIAARFHVGKKAVHSRKSTIANQAAAALEKRGWKTIDYLAQLEEGRLLAMQSLKEVQAQAEYPFPIRLSMFNAALAKVIDIVDRLARYTGQAAREPTSGPTNNYQTINIFEMMPIVRATLTLYPEALAAVDKAMKDAMNGNGHG